jgi:hypothetical protein
MLCSEALPKPRWFSRKKPEGLLQQICNNDNLQRRRKQHPPISSLLTKQNQSVPLQNPNKEKTNLDDITTKLEPASVRFQQGHNNKQKQIPKMICNDQ